MKNNVYWRRTSAPRTRQKFNQPKKSGKIKINFSGIFSILKKLRLIHFEGRNWLNLLPKIGVVTLIVFMIISVLRVDLFKIQNFEIYGVEQLSEKIIRDGLSKYEGSNIFFTREGSIASSVSSTSVFFKNIYIEKNPPNTISIFVVERFPKAVYINNTGAYLIDQENIVLQVLSKTEGLEVSTLEKDILAGFAGSQNDLVIEKLLQDEQIIKLIRDLEREQARQRAQTDPPETEPVVVDDKQLVKQVWDQISVQKKVNAFNEIQNTLTTNVFMRFDQNSAASSSTEFANLFRIFRVDNTNLNVGDKVEAKFLDISVEVDAYFRNNKQFTLSRLTWMSDFSLIADTLEGKQFVFTDRRPIWMQTEDLNYVLNDLMSRREGFRRIDLTSPGVTTF